MEKQKRLEYFNADNARDEYQDRMVEKMAKTREQEVERRRKMEEKCLRILQETRLKEQGAREKALAHLQDKERFMKQLQAERERKRKLDRDRHLVMTQMKEERIQRIARAAEYRRQEMIQKTEESDRLIAERLQLKQEILVARSQALLQMNLEN